MCGSGQSIHSQRFALRKGCQTPKETETGLLMLLLLKKDKVAAKRDNALKVVIFFFLLHKKKKKIRLLSEITAI